MEYCLNIRRMMSDSNTITGIKAWSEVQSFLRNKLDNDVVYVNITKFASDNRLLASKRVTMENLVKVANSLTDKVLYS